MIIIRVELHSAVTHQVTELARMRIANVGGDLKLRDYDGVTFRGRNTADLNIGTVTNRGQLTRWPSERRHVWFPVAAMLKSRGYGP